MSLWIDLVGRKDQGCPALGECLTAEAGGAGVLALEGGPSGLECFPLGGRLSEMP